MRGAEERGSSDEREREEERCQRNCIATQDLPSLNDHAQLDEVGQRVGEGQKDECGMAAAKAHRRTEYEKEERDKPDRPSHLRGGVIARVPADIEKERADERHQQQAHPWIERNQDERGDVEQREVREELDLMIGARREQNGREKTAGDGQTGDEFRSVTEREADQRSGDDRHRREGQAPSDQCVHLRRRPDR